MSSSSVVLPVLSQTNQQLYFDLQVFDRNDKQANAIQLSHNFLSPCQPNSSSNRIKGEATAVICDTISEGFFCDLKGTFAATKLMGGRSGAPHCLFEGF